MTTFIDTNKIPRQQLSDGSGAFAEIVNRELCGAEKEVVKLRWLNAGERLEAEPLEDTHQLVYLMEGSGVISLDGKDYEVGKGAGIYLGPSETATIKPADGASVKLLHLVVPHIED